MSYRHHHDRSDRPDKRQPRSGGADDHVAMTGVYPSAGSLPPDSFRNAQSQGAESSRGSGGVIPLSSLLQSPRSAALSMPNHPSGGDAQRPLGKPDDPSKPQAGTVGEMTPMSSRREYYDPARELDHRPSVSPDPGPSGNASGNRSPSTVSEQHSSNRLRLKVVQQPIAARACGQNERDRRVVDPPPIIQLTLDGFDATSAADRSELSYQHNVVSCQLQAVTGNQVSTITDYFDRAKDVRSLTGEHFASPFVGIDPDTPASWPDEQRIGTYFIFANISCRHTGRYRLYFELAHVPIADHSGTRSQMVSCVTSDIFVVFSAKEFPGMLASTELTHELKRQGANLPIKRGAEVHRRARGAGREESDDSTGSRQ